MQSIHQHLATTGGFAFFGSKFLIIPLHPFVVDWSGPNCLHRILQVDVSKLKFYYMDGDGSMVTNTIGPDVRAAMEKAKKHIKRTYNIDVKPVSYFYRINT